MITLASDFGSPYPAAMKGVLLQQTDTRLVDVTHGLPRQDVPTAAFWLREVLPYFPPAVHLVVVDPGVGTDRRALVVRAGRHVLVGPDNGVLLPPARRLAGADEAARSDGGDGADRSDGDDGLTEGVDFTVYVIEESLAPEPTSVDDHHASATFHGRDVFAPAAGAVHEHDGVLADLPWLSLASEYVEYSLPEPTLDANGATGEVIAVDDFGNAITNVPGETVEGREAVEVDGTSVPVGTTFAAVDPGERVVLVGSHGNVELTVNRGRGDEAFDVAVGDEVRLEY